MRMLTPSPGECADRQTILELKCKYGQLKHINTKPYSDEINLIQNYLEKEWFYKIVPNIGAQYNQLYFKLKDINSQLWRLEDEIRIRSTEPSPDKDRIVEIAMLIPKLNDERAGLVQEINGLFRVRGQEKVYLTKD